jgi:integrase/recombinase XerD
MFKTLYCCARTAARHENGPAYRSRLSYLEHLAAGGAGKRALCRNASVIYRAAVFMNLDETGSVERSVVELTAKRWANRRYRNSMALGPENTEKEFKFMMLNWLRFAGRLREPAGPPIPHQHELDAFCHYMEAERGLSPATITTSRQELTKFFRYAGERPLKELRIADVERFLAWLGERGWTRAGICGMAHRIRRFFLYGESQEWTKPGISCEIHGPRVYRQESLPLGPSWPDVQRLLASTETNRKADIRDRAILLLLAVYGMRVGEVRRIQLEDLDWERGTLTIPRTKQRRARICPLTPSLSDAIVRYLREARPKTSYRELFLRLNAPHRPFGHSGVYGVVAYRMQRLKIKAPRIGPHSLRHACATHLLAQGLTLKEVGGHLGHSSVDATRIYAKVDMPRLREVADLDLGELL